MVVGFYGITKFPDNGNYAMIMEYLPQGNLRNHLQKNHFKLSLKDRVKLFKTLCASLLHIHYKDVVHCDLHSGNILVQDGGCYITDLGVCGPVDDKLVNKVYGIIPYMAPEILRGKKYTKESDIYS